MKKRRICDILALGILIEKLQLQETRCNASLMYKLYKSHIETQLVAQYVTERLDSILGCDDWNEREMSDDETSVYNAVVTSEIEIELPCIDVAELSNELGTKLTLDEVGQLCSFFY